MPIAPYYRWHVLREIRVHGPSTIIEVQFDICVFVGVWGWIKVGGYMLFLDW